MLNKDIKTLYSENEFIYRGHLYYKRAVSHIVAIDKAH